MAIALQAASTRRRARGRALRRHLRVRKKVAGTAERPRLVVTRSARHVFVQVVDDIAGTTARLGLHHGGRPARLRRRQDRQGPKVGELVAERAKAAGVEAVVFDRGGNQYHGRVAALADGAREGGLAF